MSLCGTGAQAACERATVRGTTSAALEAADRSVVFSQVWQEKSFTEDVQRSATVNDGSMTMLDSGGEGVGEGHEAMDRGCNRGHSWVEIDVFIVIETMIYQPRSSYC